MIPFLQHHSGLSSRIKSIFSNNEQGVWYDPTDMSTLFQDSAGTIPVTGVEQPVGLMLDKSGRGNNAFQATSTKRPVLTARYNLFIKTEEFSAWASEGSAGAIQDNNSESPTGEFTAGLFTDGTTATNHRLRSQIISLVSGFSYRISVYAKASGRNHIYFRIGVAATFNNIIGYYNVSTGAIGTTARFANVSSPTVVSRDIQNIGNGWYRVELVFSANSTAMHYVQIGMSTGDNVFSYTGNTSAGGIYLWGADIRYLKEGTTIPPYQRVNTSTDYDNDPKYWIRHLRADGIDDSMVTQNVNLTGKNSITVISGTMKFADGGERCFFEHGVFGQSGIGLYYPQFQSPASGYGAQVNGSGTGYFVGYSQSFPSPDKRVLTSAYTFNATPNANKVKMFSNGEQIALTFASNFTPNSSELASRPFYLFARGGTSLYYTGRMYGLIAVDRALSDIERSNCENYMLSLVKP